MLILRQSGSFLLTTVTMIVRDTIKVRLVMTVTVTITGRARLGETGRATVTETETVA